MAKKCECFYSRNFNEPRIWKCNGVRVGMGPKTVPEAIWNSAKCQDAEIKETGDVSSVTCKQQGGITYWLQDGVEVPEHTVPEEKRHIKCTKETAPRSGKDPAGYRPPKKTSPKKVSPKVSPKTSPKKVSPKKVSPKKSEAQLEKELYEMDVADYSADVVKIRKEEREKARKAAQKPAAKKKGILTKVKEAVGIGKKK